MSDTSSSSNNINHNNNNNSLESGGLARYKSIGSSGYARFDEE
jgi:hypothetical protein